MTVHKHQFVTYRVHNQTISAIVRRVHRDGTATVEARFVLDEEGNVTPGCYLGYRYRYAQSALTPTARAI